MKLIVGLGNPGEKYKNNRHNVGFMFVDYMAPIIQDKSILLVKPPDFMNLSGKTVTQMFKKHKLKVADLVVVHDDLDIPLGKFKIQKGTGPLLHNGIESVEKSIGTKDFWRVRIGIDGRKQDSWTNGETYVLQDFKPEEKQLIDSLLPTLFAAFKQTILNKT